MSAQNPTPFSEEAAKRILARAAELDASFTGRLTEVQLREVAREAGIGDAAIEAAISESRDLDQPRPAAADPPRRTGVLRWLAPAALGLGVGVLAGSIEVPQMFLAAPSGRGAMLGFIAMCAASAVRVLNTRTPADAASFQSVNIRMWAGFFLGFTMVSFTPGADMAAASLVGGVLTGIAGAVALRLRLRAQPAEGTGANAAHY